MPANTKLKRRPPARAATGSESSYGRAVAALWDEATRAAEAWAEGGKWTDTGDVIYAYRAGYIKAKNTPNELAERRGAAAAQPQKQKPA